MLSSIKKIIELSSWAKPKEVAAVQLLEIEHGTQFPVMPTCPQARMNTHKVQKTEKGCAHKKDIDKPVTFTLHTFSHTAVSI